MDYLELPEIQSELNYIYNSWEFIVGEYIYMAMWLVGDHRVCIAVSYKIDYCIKKATQFFEADPNVRLTHINKVKIGELERMKKFELQ